MDVIGLLLGMITAPIAWPIALLIFVAIALMKGWIIPRSQSDALVHSHIKIEDNQSEQIKLIREDRDKSLAAMTSERDLWREATKDAQKVAQQVRDQNDRLIDRLEVFDYSMNAMRGESSKSGGESDD